MSRYTTHNHATDNHRTYDTEEAALADVTEPTSFIGDGDKWTLSRMAFGNSKAGVGVTLHHGTGPWPQQ